MAKVYGLTGGIASGKSTVAQRLAEHGAVIIDSDLLARQVVEPATAGFDQVVERFGTRVIGSDGSLDRGWLGEQVFNDEAARAELNAIIHPRVRALADEMVAGLTENQIGVQVIPLLVETGRVNDFDAIIVVDLPVELQQQRLIERNGLTSAQAKARIEAQASRQQRLQAADYVIDNSGSVAETLNQVDRLWQQTGHPSS